MCLSYTKLIPSCIFIYLLLLSTTPLCSKADSYGGNKFEEDRDENKRECCHSNPPSFEIRAMMVPCKANHCSRPVADQISSAKYPTLKYEAEENNRLSNCTKKMVITLKMSNVGKTHCKNQYVVLDHVYDPSSEQKQRLLYPYVLKISQKPIMQTYSLEKEGSVNDKSTELVINKNNKEYEGCKTTGEDTTCQKISYRDKSVPYSSGFCCSCNNNELPNESFKFTKKPRPFEKTKKPPNDQHDLLKRKDSHHKLRRAVTVEKLRSNIMFTTETQQISRSSFSYKNEESPMFNLEQTPNPFDVSNFGDIAEDTSLHSRHKEESLEVGVNETSDDYTVSRVDCMEEPKQKNTGKMDKLEEKLRNEYEKISKSINNNLMNDGYSENYGNILKKCQTQEKYSNPYIHPRGGQDCSNRTCPSDVDPESFQQSTHCLVFSKLWYTVFKMKKPTVFHELSLEIFEKHEDLMGHVIWHDITKGKPLIIGTSKPEDKNQNEQIWAEYIGQEPAPHAFGLDPEVHRLLVPEPQEPCFSTQFPQLKGGPYEWLVIPNYMITLDGTRCDKVGVGYEAFVRQPNRCNMPRGTCLKNQPNDLWCHDHRLEEVGQSGSYFLKYFGFLPRCPIRNITEGHQNLTMYFRSAYYNTINIELKTEYNLVLRPHAAATITEVYIDSTNYIKSTVTVKITNTGLVYGIFYVALTDCPLDMPASFNNIETKSAVIHPQHQHIFVIEIMCSLPEKRFYCSVEAKNIKHELLAFRRVRFQKNDRCLCTWHCVCTCLETDNGLTCQPLPFDHYNAAGFHGGLPMAADYVQFTLLEELMTLLYHLFLTMTRILILMGVTKGIIGIFYKPIGEWGLCSMLGLPKTMKSYHEKSLRGKEVIYDRCGWPIHPDTKKRVRNASMVVEFCINVIFFLIYPLVMMNVIVKRICLVNASDESNRQLCCMCGQTHETGQCPSLGIFKSLGLYRTTNRRGGRSTEYLRKDASIQYSSQDSAADCSCY